MDAKFLKYLFLFAFGIVFGAGCSILGGGESKIKRADSYELFPPSNWKQMGAKGESDKAYLLPSGNEVSVSSICDRTKEASLKVLTRQILIGTRNIKIFKEDEILIPSGSGLFTSIQASSEGTPFYLGIAVVKKLGCVFDFSLVSKKPLTSEETKDFLRFVKSLQYGTN